MHKHGTFLPRISTAGKNNPTQPSPAHPTLRDNSRRDGGSRPGRDIYILYSRYLELWGGGGARRERFGGRRCGLGRGMLGNLGGGGGERVMRGLSRGWDI